MAAFTSVGYGFSADRQAPPIRRTRALYGCGPDRERRRRAADLFVFGVAAGAILIAVGGWAAIAAGIALIVVGPPAANLYAPLMLSRRGPGNRQTSCAWCATTVSGDYSVGRSSSWAAGGVSCGPPADASCGCSVASSYENGG
jgi:hypothetical protein